MCNRLASGISADMLNFATRRYKTGLRLENIKRQIAKWVRKINK